MSDEKTSVTGSLCAGVGKRGRESPPTEEKKDSFVSREEFESHMYDNQVELDCDGYEHFVPGSEKVFGRCNCPDMSRSSRTGTPPIDPEFEEDGDVFDVEYGFGDDDQEDEIIDEYGVDGNGRPLKFHRRASQGS